MTTRMREGILGDLATFVAEEVFGARSEEERLRDATKRLSKNL